MTLAIVPVARSQGGPNGPRMDNLLIKMYGGVDPMFTDLELCNLDIAESPLTKYWSDRWKLPPFDTQIWQVPCAQMDIFSFDLNNQRWPTGYGTPRVYDPATDSYKCYYDATDERHNQSWCFRVALARLTNKPAWKPALTKSVDSFVPDPAAGGWIWPGFRQTPTLTYDLPYGLGPEPYHHDYNLTRADEILNATFTRTWEGDPDDDGPMPWGTWREDPQNPGNHIPLLKFYVRADDPLRLECGRRFRDEMLAVGIPVYSYEESKSVCEDMVKNLYDFHVYCVDDRWWTDPFHTYAAVDPDCLHDWFHSCTYWGGSETSSYDGKPDSANYDGFCNTEYDAAAELLKYPPNFYTAMSAAHECQKIFAKYVGAIPLWSTKGYKAFKVFWNDVINEEGVGIDNKWTFLNMYNTAPPVPATIRDGIPSNLQDPNVITSRCSWDRKFLGFIYDTLLGLDPFDLAQEYGWLALSRGPGPDGIWYTVDDVFETIGTWDPPGPVTTATTVTFTVRTNAKWHDGTPVTPDDVKFSIEFTKACGPEVAGNYESVKDVVDVLVSGNNVTVRFGVVSYWAARWAGFLPIFSKNIWLAANNTFGWGYGTPDWDPEKVRGYASYATWDLAISDGNNNGIADLKEDGCGPWIYVDMYPTMAEWVSLTADRNYFKTQGDHAPPYHVDEIYDYKIDAFHRVGDVNYDKVINMIDGLKIARALGTNRWDYPWDETGTLWDYYNPHADLNLNGYVDAIELYRWGTHYMYIGWPPHGM